ncbi:MAG: NUDIX domain-containing protein [Oscillospiraceae bacterium]|jgi:8-oxo-dGTP pyrophosphatase MutT (NUDIX family)|nr:NUDIX domain-containing protein [Oscillospiraceae bacterium]
MKVGHDRVLVVGAGVIIYKDNMVLLQKRSDNLNWSNHGGSVNLGESVEDAAKRELKEETGLIANRLEFLNIASGEHMMYTYPNGDEVYIIEINYICNDYSGELLHSSDEVLELKWFDIDNLPTVDHQSFDDRMKAFVKHINNKKQGKKGDNPRVL